MTGTAVRTEGLSKVYVKRRSLRELARGPFAPSEKVHGLREVTLEIRRGEIFGLLGPNGAGKTTLLKILSGLILPTGGRAEVEGHALATEERAAKRAIGFVTSDERSFYWRLSGEENLIFFARLYGLAAEEARRRVRDLCETMELTDVASRQFMSYSSGMKQRLAICRALLHDPPVLCLDEPTRSLDPIAAKHLRRFVSERLHLGRGKTVLLATHNLAEAEEMCGRLVVLDRGRVVRQGRLEEITSGLPGRDRYVLTVSGNGRIPDDPRWSAAEESRPGGTLRLTIAVDRGGAALTDVLRGLLAGGATILSCSRREPSLQEVFDLMDESGEGAR